MTGMTIGEEAVVDANITGSNSRNAAAQIVVTKDTEVFFIKISDLKTYAIR